MTDVLLKELTNSDIDWILTTGAQKQIPSGTVLFYQGQAVQALYILLDGALTVGVYQIDDTQLEPAEALYILLDGKLVLSTYEDKANPLTRAFSRLGDNQVKQRQFAFISRGGIVGETSCVEVHLPSTSVRAVEEFLVLSIPLQQSYYTISNLPHVFIRKYAENPVLKDGDESV